MSTVKFLLSNWIGYCVRLLLHEVRFFGLLISAAIVPNIAYSVDSVYVLTSKIPSLYVASIRQPLYPTPLKKSDQVAFHDAKEALPGLSPVLDRVVFIPRYHCISTC